MKLHHAPDCWVPCWHQYRLRGGQFKLSIAAKQHNGLIMTYLRTSYCPCSQLLLVIRVLVVENVVDVDVDVKRGKRYKWECT